MNKARLIRFVDPGTLPGGDLLALYDPSQNLVIIDRELYSMLSDHEQKRVMYTRESLVIAHSRDRAPAAVGA